MAAPSRILVVEDDETVSEVVVQYLERDGYQVESVSDGETALERVGAERPDLIVLDVMLPELSKSGTGLGLAIAKGLIQAHNGTVAVENTATGCRFMVKLAQTA